MLYAPATLCPSYRSILLVCIAYTLPAKGRRSGSPCGIAATCPFVVI